jgi:N-acetylglucosamine-6-phosphate deacetylase
MRTIIINGKILTPETKLVGRTLVLEDNKIQSIASGEVDLQAGDLVFDAQGGWVTPGLIDIHVHGARGYDTMDASPEAIFEMSRFFARHGVTSYLPTTMSESRDAIRLAIENVAQCPPSRDGAAHLGVHVEGPYFHPEFKGAQPERFLRNADPTEYEAWLTTGVVRLVTLAPERPGALDFIRRGINAGVEFALGHTSATYEQVIEAADRGLRQATHAFNGMLGLHHRQPGTVGAVLTDDRIYAQIIADGIHVHPAVVDLLVRAKGIRRTILITDAISAGGLDDGEYQLGGDKIIVKDGISRTLTGGLAGSTLTMDAAIRNMISFTGLPFQKVLSMATSVPAEAIKCLAGKGRIMPGADADIVIFDDDLHVRLTLVAGHVAFKNL